MKQPLHIFVVLIFFSLCSCSPKLSEIEDKPLEGISNFYDIKKDVPYGDSEEQVMDIYLSKDAKQLKKRNFTILYIHGGGYYLSDKKREERFIRPYLQKGMNVVNMNYRLKKGIITATEDLSLAINFLKSNEGNYSLDLNRIILTGFSAGGQMASNVGLSYNDPKYVFPVKEGIGISGVINFSGPVDELEMVEDIFVNWDNEMFREIGKALLPPNDRFSKKELVDLLEPINYFDEKDPPFLLWYGGKDGQVPPKTFQAFLPLLQQDLVKNRIIFEPEGGHAPNKDAFEAAYKKIFDFLDNLN